MRILVVGCGSMGKRRIRDLLSLEVEVVAYDVRKDRREEVGAQFPVKTIEGPNCLLGQEFSALIVSLPPDLHYGALKDAIQLGIPVFCEAPLVLEMSQMEDIEGLVRSQPLLVAPSSTYLHWHYSKEVKKLIDSGAVGEPLAIALHFGIHLADWHPYEGFGFYGSDRTQGGMGFDILVHQLHLLEWLVGNVRSVTCRASKRSSLAEFNGYDHYDLLLDCPKTSATIHCDVFQRPPTTLWTVWGEEGTIRWNWQIMELYQRQKGRWTPLPLPSDVVFESVYREEMAHFLEAVKGTAEYCHSLDREQHALQVMLAAEESAFSGRTVALREATATRALETPLRG